MTLSKPVERRPLLSFVSSSGDNMVGYLDVFLAAAFIGGAIYFAVAGDASLAAMCGGGAAYVTLHMFRIWITANRPD